MIKETVTFMVPGEPAGKGRPRFAIRKSRDGGSFVSVRTPDKTVVYENLIKIEYQQQTGRHRFPDDAMLEMEIEAFFCIPKGASKKRKAAMLTGDIRPTKKPDADNVLKAVADALNDIAYRDDTQLVDCIVHKYYDTEPRVIVTITQV